MSQLKRLVGQSVISVRTEITHIFGINQKDSWQVLAPINISFQDYTLSIYNKSEINNSYKIKDLENSKVVKIKSKKSEEKIFFSNGAILIIKLDKDSYYGPEAMALNGPNDLIIVWN